MLKLLRQLADQHETLERHGRRRLPQGPIEKTPEGALRIQVAPADATDANAAPGMRAEVWLQPDIEIDTLNMRMSTPEALGEAELCVVLGAGNMSLLLAGDLLHAMFIKNQVVVLKMNPVNEILAPLLSRIFEPLIRENFLAVVCGSREVGSALCSHHWVDRLHMTGSHRTFEAIRQTNTRPLSAELGNVSPVIVVPGPWTARELREQGKHLASLHALNGALNCLTPRLIIQHQGWARRHVLVEAIRRSLRRIETRPTFYPGVEEVQQLLLERYKGAEIFEATAKGDLPWCFLSAPSLDVMDPFAVEAEAFCPFLIEGGIEAPTPAEFIQKAVQFVHNRVWGNLVITLLVHPKTMQDPECRRAVHWAVAQLRYGTVAVNTSGALTYMTPTLPWGAFPGNPDHDIQSGRGFVNNIFNLPSPQKTVVWSRFLPRGTAPIDLTHRHFTELMKCVTDLEMAPTRTNVARLIWTAMRR
jgi:hypothetical protein